MRRELVATVGAEELTLTVEPEDDGCWLVTIEGRQHRVDAQLVRPGTWSLIVEGRSILVDLDERKNGTFALAGNTEIAVEVEDAQRKRLAQAVAGRAGKSGAGEVVKAPIAGKVVKILVEPGAVVEAGEGVAVLEAMKMENEIKADRGGKVEAVHVEPGQSVETGDKLLTLGAAEEPAEG